MGGSRGGAGLRVPTVAAGALGIGERVTVRTRMGAHVTMGEVVGNTPLGAVVREPDGVPRFYAEEWYNFSVLEDPPRTVVVNAIHDAGPDARVAAKLAAVAEAAKGKGASSKPNAGTGKATDGQQADAAEEPAQGEGDVDVEKLPQDVQRAMNVNQGLDAARLNGVLAEMGAAALNGLRRMGVPEVDIYALVGRIQAAVTAVLEEYVGDAAEAGAEAEGEADE